MFCLIAPIKYLFCWILPKKAYHPTQPHPGIRKNIHPYQASQASAVYTAQPATVIHSEEDHNDEGGCSDPDH